MISSEPLNKAIAIAEQGQLTVEINGKTITNESHVPKADTHSEPAISFPSGNNTTTYLVLNLDLDAPFGSFSFLSPILHLMQTNLKLNGAGTLSSEDPAVAPWLPAGPPPGSGPHRYAFVLYEQPETFAREKFLAEGGASLPKTARIRWDFPKFVREAGLADPVAGAVFLSN